MKKNQSEIADIVARLIAIERMVDRVGQDIQALVDPYLLAQIVEDISKRIRRKRVKTITTTWIQKTYHIGYARTAAIMDELKRKRIVK